MTSKLFICWTSVLRFRLFLLITWISLISTDKLLLLWPACVHTQLLMSDSVTQWTVTRQAPLSMGFSRQEHWSGLPSPPSGDLPTPGVKPTSPVSPALAGASCTAHLHPNPNYAHLHPNPVFVPDLGALQWFSLLRIFGIVSRNILNVELNFSPSSLYSQ